MKSISKQCKVFKDKCYRYLKDPDFNSKHAYALIESSFRCISFNVFDSGFLKSPLRVLTALFWSAIGPIFAYSAFKLMFNAQGFLELKLLSFNGLAVFLQVMTKSIALMFYSTQFRYLKKVITKDDQNNTKECESFLLSNRKTVRILMFFLGSGFFLAYIFILTFPLISKEKYMMFLPVQLPWNDYFVHPAYEINFIFSCIYATFLLFFLFGFDSTLFIHSYYIVSKLKVCEYYCSEVGNFEGSYKTPKAQTKLIKLCAKKYGEIIE
ncbi:unnamed protein product [Diamesa serratosioi]